MILIVKNLISKTTGGDLMFFQEAYYWCFQKENGQVWKDVTEWRNKGKLTMYVIRYVQYLESLDPKKVHVL